MTGTLAWNDETNSFDFEKSNNITINTGHELDIKSEKIKLDALNEDYTKCRDTIEKVDAVIDQIKDTNEIIGVGDTLTLIRSRQILDIREKLVDVIKIGTDKIRQTYKELSEKKNLLAKLGIEKMKNSQRQAYIDKVSDDAEKALKIFALESESDNILGYEELMKKLEQILSNEDKLKELASLDPMALLHVLRAFQLSSSDDIADQSIVRNKEKLKVDVYARKLSMGLYDDAHFVSKQLISKSKADSREKEEIYEKKMESKSIDKIANNAFKDIDKKSNAMYKDIEKIAKEIVLLREKVSKLKENPNANKAKIDSLNSEIADKEKEYQEKMKKQKIAEESDTLQYYLKSIDDFIDYNVSGVRDSFIEDIEKESTLRTVDNEEEFSLRLEFVKELIQKIQISNNAFIIKNKKKPKSVSASQQNMQGRLSNLNSSKKAMTASLMDSTLKDIKMTVSEGKLEAKNQEFEDVNNLFDQYTKTVKNFNKNTLTAMESMDRILSDDYESVKTKDEYREKSQHIKEMLKYVEPNDIDSIGEGLDGIIKK